MNETLSNDTTIAAYEAHKAHRVLQTSYDCHTLQDLEDIAVMLGATDAEARRGRRHPWQVTLRVEGLSAKEAQRVQEFVDCARPVGIAVRVERVGWLKRAFRAWLRSA